MRGTITAAVIQAAQQSGVTGDFLNLLLGAGGAGFLAAAYKGIKDFREGSWRRQDGAVADLEKWRHTSDEAREWETTMGEYWRSRAGDFEHVIRTGMGPEFVPPAPPLPVRQKEKER